MVSTGGLFACSVEDQPPKRTGPERAALAAVLRLPVQRGLPGFAVAAGRLPGFFDCTGRSPFWPSGPRGLDGR